MPFADDGCGECERVPKLDAEIAILRSLLKKVYRFVSPNHDPSPLSATQMAAEIMRVLEQKSNT